MAQKLTKMEAAPPDDVGGQGDPVAGGGQDLDS